MNKYIGKRLRLIDMPDDPNPVPAGTEGTCVDVDGMGNLIMKWDNGRTLNLIQGVDSFEEICATQ